MKKHLLIASIVCAAGTALAQTPAPPQPTPTPQAPPAPKTDEQKRAEAKSLYETGLSHYNLGEFDQAIAAFRAAYAISQAPGLLFNIAQSFRLKKDYEQATYFYTTYLRLKPDAPNRTDVEERLKEMEQLIAEQKKLEQSKPIGTMPPDGGGTTTQPKETPEVKEPVVDEAKLRSGQTLITASYVTAGAGGALVITGFVFGSLASSAEKDLNGLGSGDTWTSEQQARYDAGKRNNTIAIVSWIAGGAAIATGVTLYVMGTMKKKDATTLAVVPGRGGATVHVGWNF